MKYLMFLLFAAINLILVLKIPEGQDKLKMLKLTGLAIPVSLILAILVMLVIKAIGLVPGEQTKNMFFSVLMSVLTALVQVSIIIIGMFMIEKMLGFHQVYNSQNTDRLPVEFVVRNQQLIIYILKSLFFAGSLIMLYGLWVDKK
jgi:hypothetical protein